MKAKEKPEDEVSEIGQTVAVVDDLLSIGKNARRRSAGVFDNTIANYVPEVEEYKAAMEENPLDRASVVNIADAEASKAMLAVRIFAADLSKWGLFMNSTLPHITRQRLNQNAVYVVALQSGRPDVLMRLIREDCARECGGVINATGACLDLLMSTANNTKLTSQGSLEQYKQVWADMIEVMVTNKYNLQQFDSLLGSKFVAGLGIRYHDVIYSPGITREDRLLYSCNIGLHAAISKSVEWEEDVMMREKQRVDCGMPPLALDAQVAVVANAAGAAARKRGREAGAGDGRPNCMFCGVHAKDRHVTANCPAVPAEALKARNDATEKIWAYLKDQEAGCD